MNEQPEKFLLDNRYLERVFQSKILTKSASKVERLEAELEKLLARLKGVYTED